MIGLIVRSSFTIFRNTLGAALRAALVGFVVGLVLIELLAAFLNRIAGRHGFVSFHVWPPEFNTSVFTEFVHVSAILFGLVLALALVLWVIVIRAVQGLAFAANHVDDAALGIIQQTIGRGNAVAGADSTRNRARQP
jgi:hypothetical protein